MRRRRRNKKGVDVGESLVWLLYSYFLLIFLLVWAAALLVEALLAVYRRFFVKGWGLARSAPAWFERCTWVTRRLFSVTLAVLLVLWFGYMLIVCLTSWG
jgi:hypothetical protein